MQYIYTGGNTRPPQTANIHQKPIGQNSHGKQTESLWHNASDIKKAREFGLIRGELVSEAAVPAGGDEYETAT